MKQTISSLPKPSIDAKQHSDRVIDHIQKEIAKNGKPITFARYMELVLYAPDLGYYCAGTQKFGASGDFITAPEISPLFSRCIAKQCEQILEILEKSGEKQCDILEFGAGSGVMAVDILLELEKLQCLPTHYFILELSAELKKRQSTLLSQRCPHLMSRIHWIDTLPTFGFCGVMIANEVLDAMPVHHFLINEKENNNLIQEYYVDWKNDHFILYLDQPSTLELKEKINEIKKDNLDTFDTLHSKQIYQSEINLNISPWLNSISDCLKRGLLLLIDYGFPQHEYYHPQRFMEDDHFKKNMFIFPLNLSFSLQGRRDVLIYVFLSN